MTIAGGGVEEWINAALPHTTHLYQSGGTGAASGPRLTKALSRKSNRNVESGLTRLPDG
jgi:hypothetical protein